MKSLPPLFDQKRFSDAVNTPEALPDDGEEKPEWMRFKNFVHLDNRDAWCDAFGCWHDRNNPEKYLSTAALQPSATNSWHMDHETFLRHRARRIANLPAGEFDSVVFLNHYNSLNPVGPAEIQSVESRLPEDEAKRLRLSRSWPSKKVILRVESAGVRELGSQLSFPRYADSRFDSPTLWTGISMARGVSEAVSSYLVSRLILKAEELAIEEAVLVNFLQELVTAVDSKKIHYINIIDWLNWIDNHANFEIPIFLLLEMLGNLPLEPSCEDC